MGGHRIPTKMLLLTLTLAYLLGLAACSGGSDEGGAGDAQTAGRGQTTGGQTVQGGDALSADHPPVQSGSTGGGGASATVLAGARWSVPLEWIDLGSRSMRAAQYQLAPLGGEREAAELNVFFFGSRQGGGIDANIDRWVGQMSLPDGGDPKLAAERESLEVDGMPVHIVCLDGTYNAGGMGMGGQTTPKENYRMVAVILEGPEGNVFFKLTGPERTAQAMEAGLREMVLEFEKSD